jgi:hypothetical protein
MVALPVNQSLRIDSQPPESNKKMILMNAQSTYVEPFGGPSVCTLSTVGSEAAGVRHKPFSHDGGKKENLSTLERELARKLGTS